MTEPALADQVVEVLHHHDGRWSVGSGFVVRDGILLTAAHVVGAGTLLVRFRGTDERPARLCTLPGGQPAVDERTDLALVAFDGGPAAAVPVALLRDDPVLGTPNVDGCVAFGFPRFAEKDREGRDTPLREVVRVDGYIPMGEGTVEGLATLRVPDAPLGAPIPVGPLGESAWQGISGSVVFAGGHAVGIISEHHPPAGMNGLTLVPLRKLDDLAESAAWWALLGVTDRPALPRLPADVRLDAGLPATELEHRLRGMILRQPEFTMLSSPFGGLPADFYQPRLLRPAGPADEQARSVPEVVLTVERVVIIGDPGLGKTTLLHDLARRMATGEYAGLPIFVRLHDLARRGLDADLLTFAVTENFGDGLRGSEVATVADFLRDRDDVVFLFDGLDEVPVNLLDDVLARVRRTHRFVLTTRPMSRVDVLQDSGATYRITELTDIGVTAFVRQWVVKEPRATALRDRIVEDLEMAELARLPQLLVLLCWLWPSTSAMGLHSRVQILSSAVDEAMARATRISRLADADAEVVPWEVRGALRKLAKEVVTTRDGKVLTFTRLRLLELLAEVGGRDRAGMLLAFTRRTGLVVSAGGSGEDLQFLHSLFRAFLAGEALANEADPAADIEWLADRVAGHDVLVTAAALDPGRIPGLVLDRTFAREADLFGMNWWLAALCMGGVTDQEPLAGRLTEVADQVVAGASEWWSRNRFAPVVGCLHTEHVRTTLVAGLSDDEMYVRWASASALNHLREPGAAPYLAERLPAEDKSAVRCSIIVALGRLGDRDAVPALWQDFERRADEDDVLAHRAIGESLVRLGMEPELRTLVSRIDERPVRDVLIGALPYLGEDSRHEVLDALALLGITFSAEQYIQQYLDDLADERSTVDRKHNAINGLTEVATDEAASALIHAATYATDDGLREHAARALVRLPDDGFFLVVDHVVTEFVNSVGDTRLRSADEVVSLWASPAHDAMSRLSYDLPEEATAGLLDDPDTFVRAAAVVLAALSGAPVAPSLGSLVDAPEAIVRCVAVRVAGYTGATEVADVIAARLRVEDVAVVRLACLAALDRLAPPLATSAATGSLDAADPDERVAAVRVLVGEGDGADLAARLDTEPDPGARIGMIRALSGPSDAPPPVLEAIARRLSDDHDEVRQEAAEAVGEAGMSSCAPRLREMLSAGDEDEADAAAEAYAQVAEPDDLLTIVDELVAADAATPLMLTVACALVYRPSVRDRLVQKVAATGGCAVGTTVAAAVEYPRNRYLYRVGRDDRDPAELLEALADPDPSERWLAVYSLEDHLTQSGVLGAVGLAILDENPCVAGTAQFVLGSFAHDYTVVQLDDRSIATLGTAATLSSLADRLAADDSATDAIVMLLEQREFLPQLLQMYTEGRTELRRVLWDIADRHQLRLYPDGRALLPSGETVGWSQLTIAAY